MIDEQTSYRLNGLGWADGGDQFTQKIADSDDLMKKFIEFGGIVCRKGVGRGDEAVLYAYGPISPTNAVAMKSELIKDGAKLLDSKGHTWERYSQPDVNLGFPGGYAFGDGYWSFALNNGYEVSGEQVDLLDMIADHPYKGPKPTS